MVDTTSGKAAIIEESPAHSSLSSRSKAGASTRASKRKAASLGSHSSRPHKSSKGADKQAQKRHKAIEKIIAKTQKTAAKKSSGPQGNGIRPLEPRWQLPCLLISRWSLHLFCPATVSG